MLFGSLFKNDKSITAGRSRKRKMTVKDVVDRLDKVELATAECTLIRDGAGNEKVEDYGQVDIFRLRDEQVYIYENGICITTPTGMKLKGVTGGSGLAQIVSVDDGSEGIVDDELNEDEGEDSEAQPPDEADAEPAEDEANEPGEGDDEGEEEEEPIGAPAVGDAYTDAGRSEDGGGRGGRVRAGRERGHSAALLLQPDSLRTGLPDRGPV